MKKTTFTAIIGSLLVPLDVCVGYFLGSGNLIYAIPTTVFVMSLNFVYIKTWFDAQTENDHK